MNKNHRFINRFMAVITALILFVQALPVNAIAGDDPYPAVDLKSVFVTFNGQRYDILNEVLNIPEGKVDELPFELDVNESIVGDVQLLSVRGSKTEIFTQQSARTFTIYHVELLPKEVWKARVFDKKGAILGEYVLGIRPWQPGVEERMSKPIQIGFEGGSGIVVDMDEICPGMAVKMLPFVIPVTAKVTADGRTIIGFGANSGDLNFWNDVLTTNKIAENISKAKMYDQFCKEHETKWMGEGKPTFAWSVNGAAISYDKNPKKITGSINFFFGTTYAGAWQYEMFVIDVAITGGVNGSWTWTYDPDKNPDSSTKVEVEGRFKIDVGAGLGWVNVFSAGVYGAGGFSVGAQLIPDLEFTKLILSGEIGIRAKLFGRTLFQWTIVSGSHNFLKKKENEISLAERLDQRFDAMLSAGYASTYAVARNEIDEEPGWYGSNVSSPSARVGQANDDKNGINRNYSHRLASNIYPETEVQCCEIPGNNGEYLITFIGNDIKRAPGNRETLMYAVYSEATDSVTEPKPVWTNESYAGLPDYRPNLYVNESKKKIYLAWEKAVSPVGAENSFADIAAKCGIAAACYDIADGSFTEQEMICQNSDSYQTQPKIFMIADKGQLVPAIAYYTQPLNDPAGLSADNEHEFHVRYYNRTAEDPWNNDRIMTNIRGRILSFDAAANAAYEPCLSYTVKKPDGTISSGSDTDTLPEGATEVQFAKYQGQTVLTYRKDNRAYAVLKSGETAVTPEDLALPTEYQIFGDLGKNCMIAGTSSGQYSQDAVAVLHSENDGWYTTQLTEVDSFSNVNHFTAVYGSSRPVILYSVQRYAMSKEPVTYENEAGSNAAFMDALPYEETTGDLYIQAGDANCHAAIVSAYVESEVTEKGAVCYAYATIKNTGLEAIDSLYCYSRDGYNRWWDMTLAYSERIGAGQTVNIRFPVKVPYDADGYPYPFNTRIGIQLEDDPVGDVMSEYPVTVEAVDYHVKVTHRYSGGYESLIASVGFDSPGLRNGKIIFYDPDSGKVYAEQPFSKLKATETATAELSAKDRMFIKNEITKVAVRVLDENETTEKLTEMRPHYMVNTLEKQFEMPDREAFEPSAIIPETKENTTDPSESTSGRNIYKTVMIGAAAVLLVVSMTVVLFKRKKKNKEV